MIQRNCSMSLRRNNLRRLNYLNKAQENTNIKEYGYYETIKVLRVELNKEKQKIRLRMK